MFSLIIMKAIVSYIIFTVILIGAVNLLPRIYARSSGTTQTICPTGKSMGQECARKIGTSSLPTGKWVMTLDFGMWTFGKWISSGNLTINSVNKQGMIVGKYAGGDLCNIVACDLKFASFDNKTGKIGFTISTVSCTTPICRFFPPSQVFYGTELKPKIGLDTITYKIDGTGKRLFWSWELPLGYPPILGLPLGLSSRRISTGLLQKLALLQAALIEA